MEVIEYEYPDAWDAKGMNWDDPDPTSADCVMAIREAVMERAAAAKCRIPVAIFGITPGRTLSRKTLEAVVESIRILAPYFVNMGYDDYKEDYSDFPKMWTYADLVQEEGCDIYSYPRFGDLAKGGGRWLKAMKACLDRLTVIVCNEVGGTRTTRSGAEHDPPFDESISNALSKAAESERTVRFSGDFPLSVSAWSGNTHWCCPRESDKDSKDGYCGYAESASYRIETVENWLWKGEFDLRLVALVKRPEDPGPYSTVLDASVFDSAGTGLKEGLSFLKPVHVKDASKVGLSVGETSEIPRNAVVPRSEFDDEGFAVTRHSVKRGFTARFWALMDYGVENGFRFKEES